MIELIFGLLLGVVFGIVFIFIPVNSGVLFILLPTMGISPLVTLGAIIAADAITSVGKAFQILTPVGRTDNVYTAPVLASILKKGRGPAAVLTTIHQYTFIKVAFLIGGILLTFVGSAGFLKIGMASQIIAVLVAVLMWVMVVARAKNKVATTFILICGIVLAILTVKMNGTNQIFCLISAVISVPSALSIFSTVKAKLPVQHDYKVREEIHLGAAFVGCFSSFFIGIPQAPLFEAFDNEEDDNEGFTTISKGAMADGASSALGLVMVLTGGGNRTNAANIISASVPSIDSFSAILLIVFTIILTFSVYLNGKSLCKMYLGFSQKLNQKYFALFSIVVSVGFVTVSNGLLGLGVIVCGVVLSKLTTNTETSNSTSLVGISAVPLLSLVGM